MSECTTQDDFALRLSQQLLRRANHLLETKSTKVDKLSKDSHNYEDKEEEEVVKRA